MWPFTRLRYRYHRLPGGSTLSFLLRPSASLSLLIVFSIVYILIALFVSYISRRDPTSLFFDPESGYEPSYSEIRRQQADALIEAAELDDSDALTRFSGNKNDSSLCVGIATVARDDARYFRSTVGSILQGLDPKERQQIYLILFIAHTDPMTHPAFLEPWVHSLADQLLVYNVTQGKLEELQKLESDKGLFREKALFDYTYLLKACSAIGTPYIAMLEDDVIAMDGWFHRTQLSIAQAEAQTALKHNKHDFLYIRLFYTEEFLGWNREEWPTYLALSTLVVAVVASMLLIVRSYVPTVRTVLNNTAIFILCGACTPLCIVLFFAAGKPTVLPLPPGVNEMNEYGCCSQGLVFSQSKVQDMIKWYEEKNVGFVDMLTEEYGDRYGDVRWALTPSVLQHVGKRSSKGDDYGGNSKYNRSVAEKIWNFAFEMNDASVLRKAHDKVYKR